MRLGERFEDLNGYVDGLTQGKGSTLDLVRQRFALDILHHDERRVFVLPDVIDGGDIGRAKDRSSAGFPEKPRSAFGVVPVGSGQKLERHLAPQSRVFRQIYLTHAASAKLTDHPVMVNHFRRHGHVITCICQWLFPFQPRLLRPMAAQIVVRLGSIPRNSS
jgi:hypothetical protein